MRFVPILLLTLFLNACQHGHIPFYTRSIINRVIPDMKEQNVYVGDPVFIRIFKEENILELWMRGEGAREYTLVKTYPICKWSGALGPKKKEGDLQAPEGFYATDLQNLNPNSQYHLSFNMQYPNEYDRYHGYTGAYLMVHGDCRSEGCYAMMDTPVEELYILVERALLAGQAEVPIHVFPFRMTQERLRQEFTSPHYYFWRNIKMGYDYFENNYEPPMWIVRNGKYEFY